MQELRLLFMQSLTPMKRQPGEQMLYEQQASLLLKASLKMKLHFLTVPG